MITKKQVEQKYPLVVLDELDDETWNFLDGAMFDDDWDSVDCELKPRQEIKENS